MIANRDEAFPTTNDGWVSAKQAFLGVFIEDPDARETVLRSVFHDKSTFVLTLLNS